MFNILGFTASRDIAGVPADRFTDYLDTCSEQSGFVLGGCEGGDTGISRYLDAMFPYIPQTIILPANHSKVNKWWLVYEPKCKLTIVQVPQGTTYKDRNQAIVDPSEEFMAFPEYPESDPRSLRSGTWQTVRLAAKAGLYVYVVETRSGEDYPYISKVEQLESSNGDNPATA